MISVANNAAYTPVEITYSLYIQESKNKINIVTASGIEQVEKPICNSIWLERRTGLYYGTYTYLDTVESFTNGMSRHFIR